MKYNKIAFLLSIVVGLLCIANFLYKLVKFEKTDYAILLAGIFITTLGISQFYMKKK